MSRSKWKGPYMKQKTVRNRTFVKKFTDITPSMLGTLVWAHNGKSFAKIELLHSEMIGHKIGEFVTTRADFVFKKKKKKKK